MASQHRGSKKEKWEVACVCRLYELEQSLSKGPFPPALNRPIGRCNGRLSSYEFLRRLPGIPLALDDQEKIAFVTPTGNYHYKVMFFSLKNARSTYQSFDD